MPTPDDEVYRRQILARSRNYLLSYALRNQEWVLWLDVDIVYVSTEHLRHASPLQSSVHTPALLSVLIESRLSQSQSRIKLNYFGTTDLVQVI